jgi:hypothetical protein
MWRLGFGAPSLCGKTAMIMAGLAARLLRVARDEHVASLVVRTAWTVIFWLAATAW